MKLSEKSLQPSNGELVGFSGERDGTIETVYVDHKEARHCCNANLKLPEADPKECRVNAAYNVECLSLMAEPDPRTNTDDRPIPSEQLEKISFTSNPQKFTLVGTSL
ncbi:hypothetical protein PIB30_005603 [Stylosanthes scabra]|uniref:Uncharacterized protein n=1 Tax=Stylosanthes scabra TaxID=79078 RepID=A0ABU6S4F4_9FABA|nr:hypothetical protein [Stylosanthes scabra]